MARRKSTPSDQAFSVNPLWLKFGAAGLVVVLCSLAVCYFESVNRHVQADRRFSEDPVVAGWYQDTKRLVSASVRPVDSAAAPLYPVALWFGKIEECRTSNPRSGNAPELLAVKLAEPRLMAGAKGRRDTNHSEVIISTRNAAVTPRVGEQWLFSVWRDEQGYNHTKSACCYRPGPS